MKLIYRFLFYLKYLVISRSKYRIHSPFIYNYDTKVINDKRKFYAFDDIEYLRKQLLHNRTQIPVASFGAKTAAGKSNKKISIARIIRHEGVSVNFGRLLFRTVQYFKPKTILELGCGLGISTAYMAAADSKTKIISIEGSEDRVNIARLNLKVLELNQVDIRQGAFMEQLPQALKDLESLDMVFIDGDHTEEASIKLFETILPYLHNNSLVIIHDIHWSAAMTRAWEHIIKMPEANVSIDLFFAGMIFLRRQQAREHFYIWY